ncbi:MAG: MoxR family ATPase [Spirochaetota bacterium]
MARGGIIEALTRLCRVSDALKKEIAKAVVGQETTVELVLTSLIAGGHILLEGVPGLGKTLLVQAVARAAGLLYSRVQFTPDLLPMDITGSEMLDEAHGHREMRFIKGPVFTNVLLADEINRTPPKTQSALLEAMQEKQVTSYGKTHDIPSPFLVMATQNPIEHEGTYPLPEAQLDRFLFYVKLTYPALADEVTIAKSDAFGKLATISAVTDAKAILRFQEAAAEMPVSQSVAEYAVSLVRGLRPETAEHPKVKSFVSYGPGPRASQHLVIAAKAFAAVNGRDAVTKKEIDAVLPAVLRHRIIINFQGLAEGHGFEDVLSWGHGKR